MKQAVAEIFETMDAIMISRKEFDNKRHEALDCVVRLGNFANSNPYEYITCIVEDEREYKSTAGWLIALAISILPNWYDPLSLVFPIIKTKKIENAVALVNYLAIKTNKTNRGEIGKALAHIVKERPELSDAVKAIMEKISFYEG